MSTPDYNNDGKVQVKEQLAKVINVLGGSEDTPDHDGNGKIQVNDQLDQIIDILENSSGGSSLPDVTTADNGKILGVAEGAWAKVNPPASVLPVVTRADAGKVLIVNENGEWTIGNSPAVVVGEN